MHVLEALGSQYPIKGHLVDPSGPILSTALTAVDPMAASMTTGHYWALLGITGHYWVLLGICLVHTADK